MHIDPAAAARWIGTVLLVMGGADLLLALLWSRVPDARLVALRLDLADLKRATQVIARTLMDLLSA